MTERQLLVGPFNRVEGDLEIKLDIRDGQVAAAHVAVAVHEAHVLCAPGAVAQRVRERGGHRGLARALGADEDGGPAERVVLQQRGQARVELAVGARD